MQFRVVEEQRGTDCAEALVTAQTLQFARIPDRPTQRATISIDVALYISRLPAETRLSPLQLSPFAIVALRVKVLGRDAVGYALPASGP